MDITINIAKEQIKLALDRAFKAGIFSMDEGYTVVACWNIITHKLDNPDPAPAEVSGSVNAVTA